MRCRFVVCTVNRVCCCFVQGVVHQSGFARARHTGHTGEQAHRKVHRHIFQIVATRTVDANHLFVSRLFVEQTLRRELLSRHR